MNRRDAPAGVSGPRISAPSLAALAQWASSWSRPREISYQRSLRSRYTSRRLPGLALTADHAHLLQVAHGAGDRCRAGPEQLAELGGGQAARVGDQQGGEDPGRHRRNARLHEDRSEPLDERADRLLIAAPPAASRIVG